MTSSLLKSTFSICFLFISLLFVQVSQAAPSRPSPNARHRLHHNGPRKSNNADSESTTFLEAYSIDVSAPTDFRDPFSSSERHTIIFSQFTFFGGLISLLEWPYPSTIEACYSDLTLDSAMDDHLAFLCPFSGEESSDSYTVALMGSKPLRPPDHDGTQPDGTTTALTVKITFYNGGSFTYHTINVFSDPLWSCTNFGDPPFNCKFIGMAHRFNSP